MERRRHGSARKQRNRQWVMPLASRLMPLGGLVVALGFALAALALVVRGL